MAFPVASFPENDPELAIVVGRWPTLPEPFRRAVMAMIEAAGLEH